MGAIVKYHGEFTFRDEESLDKALLQAEAKLDDGTNREGGSFLEKSDLIRDDLTLRIDKLASGPSRWGYPAESVLQTLAEHALEGGVKWADEEYAETILPTCQYHRRVVVQLHQSLPHEGRNLDAFGRDLKNAFSETHNVYEEASDQITINTSDPNRAFDEMRPLLEQHTLTELAVVAFREPATMNYRVVWPENYDDGFDVMYLS